MAVQAAGDQQLLLGRSVCFTGKLASLKRREACRLVSERGGVPVARVTRSLTYLVVGEEGYLRVIEKSRKLRAAERLNQKGAKISIVGEGEFLQTIGLESTTDLKSRFYGIRDVCRLYSTLSPRQIRYLEKAQLVVPARVTNSDRYYGFHDLLALRKVHLWLQKGGSLKGVAESLRVEKAGQLSLAYLRGTSQVLSLSPPVQEIAKTADEWFEEGCQFDEDPQTFSQAIHAYQQAVTLEPDHVLALLNLGAVYHRQRHLEEAQSLYFRAAKANPQEPRVHFNLGIVAEDMGDIAAALLHYKRAVAVDPSFPDAHFNVARLYQSLDLGRKARNHWRAYIRLDPDSEWAAIARKFLMS